MKVNHFFKKGFNHGYILSKENPKYLQELLDAIKNKEAQYTIGLQSAKNLFIGKSHNKDQDKGRGRGM